MEILMEYILMELKNKRMFMYFGNESLCFTSETAAR